MRSPFANGLSDYQRRELFRIVGQAVDVRPEAFTLLCEVAAIVWRRYHGPLGAGDEVQADEAALLDLFCGRWTSDEAALDLLLLWKDMPTRDRETMKWLLAITRPGSTPESRERTVTRNFTSALVRYARRYLTESELAQVAARLTEAVVGGPTRARDAADTASARVQVIADQFPLLTPGQQEHVAAIVAALANGTRHRQSAIRIAVRRFLRTVFDVDDLTYLVRVCIGWIARDTHPSEETVQ